MKKEIILLGSNGSIRVSLKNYLKNRFILHCFDIPELDITKKNFEKYLLKKIDNKKKYILINCIGLMGADESKKNVEKYLDVNSFFPSELLEKINDKIRIEKYIYLSSETVYGNGKNLSEKSLKNPIHPYAMSKLYSEINIKKTFSKIKKKFSIIILRIPVVVFESQKFDNTLTLICKEYKEKRKMIIFGNGKHERNYIYIDDLNEIFLKFIKKKLPAKINIFNIPGNKASTLKIVNLIKKKTGSLIKLKFIQNSKAFSLISSSNKFNSTFNYKLNYNLEKIINLKIK